MWNAGDFFWRRLCRTGSSKHANCIQRFFMNNPSLISESIIVLLHCIRYPHDFACSVELEMSGSESSDQKQQQQQLQPNNNTNQVEESDAKSFASKERKLICDAIPCMLMELVTII